MTATGETVGFVLKSRPQAQADAAIELDSLQPYERGDGQADVEAILDGLGYRDDEPAHRSDPQALARLVFEHVSVGGNSSASMLAVMMIGRSIICAIVQPEQWSLLDEAVRCYQDCIWERAHDAAHYRWLAKNGTVELVPRATAEEAMTRALGGYESGAQAARAIIQCVYGEQDTGRLTPHDLALRIVAILLPPRPPLSSEIEIETAPLRELAGLVARSVVPAEKAGLVELVGRALDDLISKVPSLRVEAARTPSEA